MSLELRETDLTYAHLQAQSEFSAELFFEDLISRGAAEVAKHARRIRDAFFQAHAHVDLTREAVEQGEAELLRVMAFVVGGLYSATGERVPKEFFNLFTEFEHGCMNDEVLNARHDRIASLGHLAHRWMASFVTLAREAGFPCEHALGPILALVDAWITAYEREEALAQNRKLATEWEGAISPSVASALREALGNDKEESEA